MSFPTDHCNEIMRKLKERRTSQFFQKPVDTKIEDYKEFPQVIKKPMDMETISRKINTGVYKNVLEWRNDVELMFNNALKYFDLPAMIIATKDLQSYFRKISNELSDFPEIDWATRLARLEGELRELMENAPESMKPRIIKSKKQKPLSDSAKNKKKFQAYTSDDIIRLTRDIHNIKNNDQILELLNVVVKNESSIDAKDETVEVQMNTIRPQTYHELRSLVDGYLSTV